MGLAGAETWNASGSRSPLRLPLAGLKLPVKVRVVEAPAARIARVRGTLAPRLRRCRLTLFAGDHGITAEGVSAYPQAVTRQMVENFLAGGAVVIVDGFIASAAALTADRMAPALRGYLVFAHRSAEPGHRAVLYTLGARPLLDLGLRLGEGTGALLAWPILRVAAAMLSDMASFENAGVSGPEASGPGAGGFGMGGPAK